MQKLVLLFSLWSIPTFAIAQEPVDSAKLKSRNAMKLKMIDSIRSERLDQAALLYPRLRQFSIVHQMTTGGSIRSRLYDQDFFSGRIRMARTTVNMNLPIISNHKHTLVASLAFVHQFLNLSEIRSNDPRYAISDATRYIPMFNVAMTYSRRDTLLGLPLNLSASVGSLFNPDFSSGQLRFLGVASTTLFRKESSSLSLGVVAFLDPTSLIPVLPMISYAHRFRSLGLDLTADLPSRIALRKKAGKRSYFSLYSEVAGYNSFFGFDATTPALPEKLAFAQTEIKSGLLFEQRLTQKAVFSLSGGINTTLRSRITRMGARQNDYLIDNKNGATAFVQAGISLLPFWEPFKRRSAAP